MKEVFVLLKVCNVVKRQRPNTSKQATVLMVATCLEHRRAYIF